MKIEKKIKLFFCFLIVSGVLHAQESNHFYKNIEPTIYIGAGQWVNSAYNRLEIKRPSYELRLSYNVDLSDHFLLLPFIGYSKIIADDSNLADGIHSHFTVASFDGGSVLFYKIKRWNLGAEINAKKIIKFKYIDEDYNNVDDLTQWFNAIFYQTGANVSYSFDRFKISVISIWTLTPIHSTFFVPQRLNEHLLGIAYRL